MVKLKRLTIHHYRNVEPCELIFDDRRNVLLGPNGAGKTTLLSLISKVLRTNLTDPGDPFSIELELTFPQGSLTGKIASRKPEPEPAELLRLPPMARAGHEGAYAIPEVPDIEFTLSLSDRQTPALIHRSHDQLIIEHAELGHELPLRFVKSGPGLLSTIILFVTAMREEEGPVNIINDLRNAYRFDESLDMFRALTAREDDVDISKDDLRPRIRLDRPIKARARSGPSITVSPNHGVVSSGIIDAMKLGLPLGSTDYSINNEQLAFLSRLVRLLGLRSATAKVELVDKNAQFELLENKVRHKLTEQFEFGNLKFWFTRRDGSIFQDQHLSYGQKRLLAFLYYLDANPSFVIADELVNGLHHAWIEECMNAIGDRQAFLTSQNPLLLDYLSFESAEQVKESFILCRNQADGDRERMIWRNMTDDEADMFYRAYQVGIEHVGEILRTRGLW
ncbi:AAA family ATPase [Sorangium sp. So ce1097]|uniref:AAA family ATPase n=1 Tax=Sorangium sp. So ce1097 TaxID=3133330 RepID=UPI003F60F7B9